MTSNVRVNVDSRMLMHSETNRKGGDPSLLFEILEGAIEGQDWLYLTDDYGEPLGTFIKFIEAPYPVGCGMEPEKLLALLQVQHKYEGDDDIAERMAALRDTVNALLPAIVKHGGDRRSENAKLNNQVVNHNLKTGGDSPSYIRARLKRDRPDLDALVGSGDLSVREAAIEAGFRSPRIAVRLDDMCSAARTLASKLDADQINELIFELQKQQRS